MIIALIAAYVFYGVAVALDVRASERGFAAGFVEGNSVVHSIFGGKPTTFQLLAYNVAWAVLVSVPMMLTQNEAIVGATFGALLAASGKHLVAVRKWAQVMAGVHKQPTSIVGKIIGL